MNETINIVRLRQPHEIGDTLTDGLRSGARKLLAQAIEMEAEAYAKAVDCLTEDQNASLAFYDFPRRTLGSSANVQSHRKRLCDRSPPHGAYQGLAILENRPADGLQAGHGRGQDVATIERTKSVAGTHRRCQVPGRNRGHRKRSRRAPLDQPRHPNSSIAPSELPAFLADQAQISADDTEDGDGDHLQAAE